MPAILIKLWPLWACLAVGAVSGVTMHTKGMQTGYERSIKEFKDSYKPQECPDCNCPPNQSALDIDKLKGFKNFRGTINVPVTQQMIVDGDSTQLNIFKKAVEDALEEKLKTIKLAKCK